MLVFPSSVVSGAHSSVAETAIFERFWRPQNGSSRIDFVTAGARALMLPPSTASLQPPLSLFATAVTRARNAKDLRQVRGDASQRRLRRQGA